MFFPGQWKVLRGITHFIITFIVLYWLPQTKLSNFWFHSALFSRNNSPQDLTSRHTLLCYNQQEMNLTLLSALLTAFQDLTTVLRKQFSEFKDFQHSVKSLLVCSYCKGSFHTKITVFDLKPSISHLHHRFVVIIIGFRFLAVRLPQDNVNIHENIFVTYASRYTYILTYLHTYIHTYIHTYTFR